MKVIKPIAVTAAVLVSTNATESIAAWAAGTAYAADDQALLTATQRIYQRIVAGTTATAPNLDTTNWLDIGPTNKYAMFDSLVSTQTEATDTLTVVLKPSYANSLALFNLVGQTLEVTVRDALAGNIVYSATQDLDGTLIADWYQYFFEPSVQRGDLVLSDLPPYGDAHITLTISGTGTVKCGHCLVGTAYDLGDTQYGASASLIDYSRKETDEFGITSFVRRAYSKRMTAKMTLENAQLNKVQRVLADLRATPCAWIAASAENFGLGTGYEAFEPLTLFGFYKDFSIDVAYATTSYCSLEIEGLT